jgi:hypothetical protein
MRPMRTRPVPDTMLDLPQPPRLETAVAPGTRG